MRFSSELINFVADVVNDVFFMYSIQFTQIMHSKQKAFAFTMYLLKFQKMFALFQTG